MMNKIPRRAGRVAGWFSVMVLAVMMSGCIKQKIVIHVEPDGSGRIMLTQVFSKETVAMFDAQMAAMKAQMGSASVEMNMPEDPFYDENALKRMAGIFGPDATFKKARKYERGGARGAMAMYEFKDINEVYLNLKHIFPDMESRMGAGMMGDEDAEVEVEEKGDDVFEFAMEKGAPNTLRITLPEFPEPKKAEEGEDDTSAEDAQMQEAMQAQMRAQMMAGGNPWGLSGEETVDEIFHKMYGGMQMELVVEVGGEVVKSDAKFPVEGKKSSWTLVDIDLSKILATEQGKKALTPSKMNKYDGPNDFFGAMIGYPGVTCDRQKAITVQFK